MQAYLRFTPNQWCVSIGGHLSLKPRHREKSRNLSTTQPKSKANLDFTRVNTKHLITVTERQLDKFGKSIHYSNCRPRTEVFWKSYPHNFELSIENPLNSYKTACTRGITVRTYILSAPRSLSVRAEKGTNAFDLRLIGRGASPLPLPKPIVLLFSPSRARILVSIDTTLGPATVSPASGHFTFLAPTVMVAHPIPEDRL